MSWTETVAASLGGEMATGLTACSAQIAAKADEPALPVRRHSDLTAGP